MMGVYGGISNRGLSTRFGLYAGWAVGLGGILETTTREMSEHSLARSVLGDIFGAPSPAVPPSLTHPTETDCNTE